MPTCKHCGFEREAIPSSSYPVKINKKLIEFIPSWNCPKCGGANYPTFYQDITDELAMMLKKRSVVIVAIASVVSFFIGYLAEKLIDILLGF